MTGRKLTPFKQAIAKPEKLGPEANPNWWNPSRVGVRGGPADFEKQLKEFDPDLRVTWNAYTKRWQLWMHKPKLRNPITMGWLLLFVWKYPDGSYAPLDNRVFARLYSASAAKWGNGKKYFDRVAYELEHEREQAEATRKDNVKYAAGEFYDHILPRVGYGSNTGSKFSTYHS